MSEVAKDQAWYVLVNDFLACLRHTHGCYAHFPRKAPVDWKTMEIMSYLRHNLACPALLSA